MVFTGTVGEPVTMTVGGNAATVDANNNWRGHATVKTGANAIPLVATDVDNNTTNKTINVTVSGGAARIPKYDANGNLTNDGNGKTYTYDAMNRMVSVTQGSNVTSWAYDGMGRRVQEKLNGTVVKQWVWCTGAQPCEERDASNNVTKRFYGQGEQISGTNYYYTRDNEGSIREMTNASGALIARYDYDPYGRRTLVSGTDLADFGFTGFYYHQASGLNFTVTRAYDANLGRWLSRDTIGEKGGLNLYDYVRNNPDNFFDPMGLQEIIIEPIIEPIIIEPPVIEPPVATPPTAPLPPPLPITGPQPSPSPGPAPSPSPSPGPAPSPNPGPQPHCNDHKPCRLVGGVQHAYPGSHNECDYECEVGGAIIRHSILVPISEGCPQTIDNPFQSI